MTYPDVARLRTQTETLTLGGDQMLLLLQFASLGQAICHRIVNHSQIASVRELMKVVGDERTDAVLEAAIAIIKRHAETLGTYTALPDRDV